MAVKRNYHSVVRTEQREQTARRLLEAFSALVREGEQEITVPKVARRAEVSAPTAYKHYPTVEALIEAYWSSPEMDWVPPKLDSMESVTRLPAELFQRFDENRTWMHLVNSAHAGELGRAGKRQRTRRVTERVAEFVGPLPPESARLVPLLIRSFTSYHNWVGLTESLELPTDEAAQLVSWTMKLVFEELQRNPHSFEEHRHAQADLRP